MKKVNFPRTMFVSMILLGLVVPLYAHHGTQFLTQAMESNTAELELAKLAESHSENSKVKEFAMMMVTDHTKALAEMQDLYDARAAAGAAQPNHAEGDHPNIPVNTEDKLLSSKLSKLTGAEFDREYMAAMVDSHRAAVELFEEQSHAHGANLSTGDDKAAEDKTPIEIQRQKPSNNTVDFTTDADTAAFANKTLPTIRMHLEHAESIQKELGN